MIIGGLSLLQLRRRVGAAPEQCTCIVRVMRIIIRHAPGFPLIVTFAHYGKRSAAVCEFTKFAKFTALCESALERLLGTSDETPHWHGTARHLLVWQRGG
jgi:hypothetical protein